MIAKLGKSDHTSSIHPRLFAAPLQGYTTAPFRHFHAAFYGHEKDSPGEVTYIAPFLRIEHGAPRAKELNDIASPLNANHRLVPQIIFGNEDEFERLTDAVASHGFSDVNLNLGCPYPMQRSRGRGAAFVCDPTKIEMLARWTERHSDMRFSIKMRPGVESCDEWRASAAILADMKPEWIAMHPRRAADLYRGNASFEVFREFAETVGVERVVYNGDIDSPEKAELLLDSFPCGIAGIMIGRWMLADPAAFTQLCGNAMPDREMLFRLHDAILTHYRTIMTGGDHQLLSRIREFWGYAEPTLGRKAWKKIVKAGTLRNYDAAVAEARRQYCR